MPTKVNKNKMKQRIAAKSRKGKSQPNKQLPGRLIRAPAAMGRVTMGRGPAFLASSKPGSGSIRVSNREFISDLASGTSQTFTVCSFLGINPGLSTTFPWLSAIARKFESYKFRSLRFIIETEAATSLTGSAFLAIDFDASDAAPLSKQQMMSYKTSVRSPVWSDCACSANKEELHKLGQERYVRGGALAANLDIRASDVGNLIAAALVQGATTVFGELYVEYDVELYTPQTDPSVDAVANSAKLVATGTVDRATPFGTTAPTVTGGLQVAPTSAGTGLGFANAGEYLVVVASTGTAFTDTLPVLTAVGANSVTALSPAQHYNAAATASTYYFMVQVKQPSLFVNGLATTNAFTLSYAGNSTTYTANTTRVAMYGYANA